MTSLKGESGYTLNGKIAYVTQTVVPMLENDLRNIVEMRCEDHGTPGSGPNFSICLMCFVACETLGGLLSGQQDSVASAYFLREISRVTGDARYRDSARFIVALFRNGIAHTFLPKMVGPLAGTVVWFSDEEFRTTCIDKFVGNPSLPEFVRMRTQHLSLKKLPNLVSFRLSPQVFCVDLLVTIKEMVSALQAGDETRVAALDSGFEAWFKNNSVVQGAVGKELNALIGKTARMKE